MFFNLTCSLKVLLMYLTFYSQNYPLYIRTIPTENELKFHYTVHTCLDVIEEKVSSAGKSANDPRELYLGLLYPTEDYKVYGYVTNTKVKFVIVVDSSNTQLRDNEIRNVSAMFVYNFASTLKPRLYRFAENCKKSRNRRYKTEKLIFT